MPVPASEKRIAWERRYLNTVQGNYQLYCANGHGIGDEHFMQDRRTMYSDDYQCPYCGTGKPWLYRWEVD